MNQLSGYLKARASEKSTWVGILMLAASVYTGPYLALVNAALPAVVAALGGGLATADTTNADARK